jgi:nitrite reductase/ring-hydroxylating ferredoxin subunit
MSELEKAIDAAGYTPVAKANYSNQGHVHAMAGLRSKCVLGYDFQYQYFRLQLADKQGNYGGGVRCPCGGGLFDYTEGERLEKFLLNVTDYLTKARTND